MKYNNITGPQVRKFRHGHRWSQEKLAVRLQCAGWDIGRSEVAKIEAQLKLVRDFELGYLREVFGIEVKELFPDQRISEMACDYVNRILRRKH